jgi:hypothetical protein
MTGMFCLPEPKPGRMLEDRQDSNSNGKINPLCLAVSGNYQGLHYDGINVTPLLEKEKILISVKVENNRLKTVADVDFPAGEQTHERFQQLLKRAIGQTLQVLI